MNEGLLGELDSLKQRNNIETRNKLLDEGRLHG